jgi:trigger factor
MPEEKDKEATTLDETETQAEETVAEEQEPAAEEAEEDKLPKPEISVEDAGVARKKVSVKIPEERIKGKLDSRYSELRSEVDIPGFRRGRAPRRLIEKRLGKDIAEEVKVGLISEAIQTAVTENNLATLGEPDLDIEKITFPEEGEMTFSFEVDVRPEFELPQLEGVELQLPKREVTEEMVTQAVDQFRKERGVWEPLDGGEVKPEDMVVCDVSLTVEEKEIDTAAGVTLPVRPGPVLDVFISDLDKILTGAKVGETKTTEVTLPVAWPDESLQGKQGVIGITVHGIRRIKPAEIDNMFLETYGVESEQQLRDIVRNSLQRRLESEIRRAMHSQMQSYLEQNTDMELPEKLTAQQTERAFERRKLRLMNMGIPEDRIDENIEKLKESSSKDAVYELKLFFILQKIADMWNIEASEEEINASIHQMAMQQGRRPEQVRSWLISQDMMSQLVRQLQEDKVLDELISKAKVTEVEQPPQEEQGGEEQPEQPLIVTP